MNKKVLVLGLDGLDLSLVKKWRSELPNLSLFMRRGIWGTLKSTEPPITVPAWPAFFTGKNPGKLGIYTFRKRKANAYDYEFVNQTYLTTPTLWKILSRHKKRSLVINVPMTYPVEKINGILISGMLTPPTAKVFAFPPKIQKEVKRAGYFIDNIIQREMAEQQPEKLPEIAAGWERKRVKCFCGLLKKETWDFAMIVLSATDIVSHFFFDTVNRVHNPVKKTYIICDRLAGKIIKAAGKNTILIGMSDHGFRSMSKGEFRINAWLEKEGYLVRKKSVRPFFTAEAVVPLLKKTGIFRIIGNLIPKELIKKIIPLDKNIFNDPGIDWEKTRAYSSGMSTICLNLQGREPLGCVKGHEAGRLLDEIADKLKRTTIPGGKTRLVDRISLGKEIYKGPFCHEGPDIVFSTEKSAFYATETLEKDIWGKNSYWQGNHRRSGFLGLAGKGIKKCHHSADILDLAPTILYIFDLPIPADMDGEVLKPVRETFHSQKKISQDITAQNNKRAVFSPQEEQEIKKRLKGLGYL